jgi:CheY-like chemotaxis protein
VVDDNELVREVPMMSLEEAGFAAEGAEDTSRALVYMDQQQAVDALITDFTITGMTGLDLIREAAEAGAQRRTDRSARRRDRRSRGLIGHARVIRDLCLRK